MSLLSEFGILLVKIIASTAIMVLSILIHEFGHYRIAKMYGNAKIMWKDKTVMTVFDDHLTLKQKIQVFKHGILLGFIPITLYMAILPEWAIVLFFLYIGGCISDFKVLRSLYREKKSKKIFD